jgi:predicted metal-dependent phosphoesterase TrpH
MIDLHTHTTASDGTLTPIELVEHAKQKGVTALAITDHDTLEGVKQVQQIGISGIEIISGIEVSTHVSMGEVHILGYFVQETKAFIETIKEVREKRDTRNKRIVEKMQSINMNVTMEDALQEAKGDILARPHLARALIKKGYAKTMDEAFEKYLVPGTLTYVAREKFGPKEGIELVLKAKGVPVLAHPRDLNLYEQELDDFLVELKRYGLIGIEAHYSANTQFETGLFLRKAVKHDLVATGGTDFHGANRPDVEVGIGRGNMNVSYEVVEKLKQKLSCKII